MAWLIVLIILLLISFAIGWIAAKHFLCRKYISDVEHLPESYFLGLNFILNEQPDRAVDLFIKMLIINHQTIETHLALGGLFQRRGEIDRAIKVHQNIVACDNIDNTYRYQALVALAEDYLKAGVLDRAEQLFLECVEFGDYRKKSLLCLLAIYEQEKEWNKAIDIGKQLISYGDHNVCIAMAHYYCELAKNAIQNQQCIYAEKLLKRALSIDNHCIRISLLFAELEFKRKNYKKTIYYLKRIKEQDPDFLSESISYLIASYCALNQEKKLILYLENLVNSFPKLSVIIKLSEQIQKTDGSKAAAKFISEHVRKYPSVLGINRLIELNSFLVEGDLKKDLLMLHNLMEKLLSKYPSYRCVHCGFSGNHLHWQCPSCRFWGVIKPIIVNYEF